MSKVFELLHVLCYAGGVEELQGHPCYAGGQVLASEVVPDCGVLGGILLLVASGDEQIYTLNMNRTNLYLCRIEHTMMVKFTPPN